MAMLIAGCPPGARGRTHDVGPGIGPEGNRGEDEELIQPADALPDRGTVAINVSCKAKTRGRTEFHARCGRGTLRDQSWRFEEKRQQDECKECKRTKRHRLAACSGRAYSSVCTLRACVTTRGQVRTLEMTPLVSSIRYRSSNARGTRGAAARDSSPVARRRRPQRYTRSIAA